MLNFTFEQHSHPDAPLVIFVNGVLADYQSFDGAAFYARENFHVLRFNCRGQDLMPLSEVIDNDENIITLNQHVNDLKELINYILKNNVQISQMFLVGLSNGGRIALKLIEDNEFVKKSHITSVVALDTYDVLTPLLRLKLKSWLEASRIGGALHRFDVASPWIWGETFLKEKEDIILSYRQKIIDGQKDAQSMNVLGLLKGALKNNSEEDRIDLEKIKTPVFLIVGEEDLLTTPDIHLKMHTKLSAGKVKIISKMGHAGLIENPMLMKTEIIPYFKTFINS